MKRRGIPEVDTSSDDPFVARLADGVVLQVRGDDGEEASPQVGRRGTPTTEGVEEDPTSHHQGQPVGSGRGELRVGTSGFQYRHWKGDFYPDDLVARHWFGYYCRRFDTVEINNTFYNLPDPESFDAWREVAPRGFRFGLKYSRYATHLKHLKDPERPLERFLERAERLHAWLGPILVQLPPRWGADPDRLDAFLRIVPRRRRVAVEVRDPDWLREEVYEVLRRRRAALVIHDMIDDHPAELTTGWTYLRFHGRQYGGSYSPQALSGQARRIRRWLDEGRDVYAYFNNDRGGHAPRNAADLRRFVEDRDA